MTALAPVAIFAYNRPRHLARLVESLRANVECPKSEVFLFSDGPRTEAQAEQVAAVRRYAKALDGFQTVHVVERPRNFGLAASITDGVTSLCERFGRVIVLEDDLVVSRYFLDYVNRALDKYATDNRVGAIGCYLFPGRVRLPETFFLRVTDCWGWAVWKRSWDQYEPNGAKLLGELETRRLTREFDFGGAYPYTRMLRDQVAGRNDSWAVRWYARALLSNWLTLYPGRSVTRNVGMDDTGTHSGRSTAFETELADRPISVEDTSVREDQQAVMRWTEFFDKAHGSSGLRYHLRSWVAQIPGARAITRALTGSRR